jgi:hypothetical protein
VKASLLGAIVLIAAVGHPQDNRETHLTGTAINTTNPEKPIAAPIEIVVAKGTCRLTVSPPLVGSGACHIKAYDQKTGHLEIASFGQPAITWTGTVKGNFASGTYKIDLGAQSGSFYMAILRQPANDVSAPPPAVAAPRVPGVRSSCAPAIETSIDGEINGWEGETIFKLANGQIWQQAEYDYNYFYDYSPDVTIYETSSGCRMKVDGEDETVLVKRIK